MKPTEDIPMGVLEKYHFLTKGYEPEYFYWEIIVMLRKVAMVFISVYIKEFRVQSLMAVLLNVIALAVHALFQPFVSEQVDLLEWLSLFGSFCTYFFGQFLFPGVGITDGQQRFISFVIAVVSVVVMFTILYAAFRTIWKDIKASMGWQKDFDFEHKAHGQLDSDKEKDFEREHIPDWNTEHAWWYFTGVNAKLNSKNVNEIKAWASCRQLYMLEDGFAQMISYAKDPPTDAIYEIVKRTEVKDGETHWEELYLSVVEMMMLVNVLNVLENLQAKYGVSMYAVGTVLCVQSDNEDNLRLAVKDISRYLGNIRSMDALAGFVLVEDQIMTLEKKYPGLRIMSHENFLHMYSPSHTDVSQAMQDAVNILALIREDYLGDITPLLEASSELQDCKSSLDLEWIVDGFDTYLFGNVDHTLTFWRKTMELSSRLLRVHVGPRAPMVLLFDDERRNVEKEFKCQIGYSEQGDSVLVLPSDDKLVSQIVQAVHKICKTVMDISFHMKPLGIKLYSPGDDVNGSTNLSQAVRVSAVGENAQHSGLIDGTFILQINGETVVGQSKQELVKRFQKAELPVVVTTGACENALDIICFHYDINTVMYDLFDWVSIKRQSKCRIKPRNISDDAVQVLLGGPKEDVIRCVSLLKAESEEIEIVDVVGISFVMHHADCRILNRLKEDCNVVSTDINDLRYANKTRIAIRGNFVDRHKFKSYLDNVRMNMLEIVSNTPISRDFITNLHNEMGAIVSVHPRDPQMAYIHDGLFHPGTKMRLRRLRSELRKSPTFQAFAEQNQVILGDENPIEQ